LKLKIVVHSSVVLFSTFLHLCPTHNSHTLTWSRCLSPTHVSDFCPSFAVASLAPSSPVIDILSVCRQTQSRLMNIPKLGACKSTVYFLWFQTSTYSPRQTCSISAYSAHRIQGVVKSAINRNDLINMNDPSFSSTSMPKVTLTLRSPLDYNVDSSHIFSNSNTL